MNLVVLETSMKIKKEMTMVMVGETMLSLSFADNASAAYVGQTVPFKRGIAVELLLELKVVFKILIHGDMRWRLEV